MSLTLQNKYLNDIYSISDINLPWGNQVYDKTDLLPSFTKTVTSQSFSILENFVLSKWFYVGKLYSRLCSQLFKKLHQGTEEGTLRL